MLIYKQSAIEMSERLITLPCYYRNVSAEKYRPAYTQQVQRECTQKYSQPANQIGVQTCVST